MANTHRNLYNSRRYFMTEIKGYVSIILDADSPPSHTASVSDSSMTPSLKHQDDDVRFS